MNHFAHAWIASQIRPAPRFVLGAILPDLLSFLRIPLPPEPCPDLAAGIALHHATDAVFHRLADFRERNRAGSRRLRSLGLSRGHARAASHVGIELTLDAALAAASEPAAAHYRSALAESGQLSWPDPARAHALNQLTERLAQTQPASASPTQLAERVRRTLAPRPALALRQQDLSPLASWLGEITPDLTQHAASLANRTLWGVRSVARRSGQRFPVGMSW